MKLITFVPLLLMAALLLVLYWQVRSMKKRQDALVAGLRGQRYWRINLARPAFMKRWMRLMAFEAKGVLVDEGEQLRIKGFWRNSDRAFDSVFARKDVQVEWLGNQQFRAGMLHWARFTAPRGVLLFCADTGMNAHGSREALADIFRSAFPEQELGEEQTTDFALEKNPASLAAMALFFGLFLFALLDSFFINRYELADTQIVAILTHPVTMAAMLVGVAGGTALAVWSLLRCRVPMREAWALGSIVVAAAMAAALPLAKRVDQVLATGPTQNYAYKVVGLARLEPADPRLGLPQLRYPKARDYWAQYDVGAEYQMPFLRGPLGLWQLDHAVFDPPLRAFYDKKYRAPAAP